MQTDNNDDLLVFFLDDDVRLQQKQSMQVHHVHGFQERDNDNLISVTLNLALTFKTSVWLLVFISNWL